MGEQITLTCKDGVTIGAYLARPAGQPKGAVVVLQEIFGVNQHIRADADKFAAAGYLAIAPQLYDRVEPNSELGYTGDEPKKGMDIRAKTELPKTLMDIEAAIAAVKSAGKVDTAYNNRNFHEGRYTLHEYRRLTDTNNWFLVDSSQMKQNCFWSDRIGMEFAMVEDFDTLVAKWRGYMRYAMVQTGWRWVIGSQVS